MYVMVTYLFFLLWFPFKGEGSQKSFHEWFCLVIKNPAVSLTLWDLIPQYHWHRGSNPLVSLTLCDLISQCQSPQFNDSTESAMAVTLRLWNHLQKCSSKIPWCHWHLKIWSWGIIDTAVSDPVVSLTPQNPNFSNNYLNFLGKCVAICEMASGCELGPLGCWLMKKNLGSKISWHCPFKTKST
jgi:hypothetical protein